MNNKIANFFMDFNVGLSNTLGSRFDYAKLLAYLKRKKTVLTLESEIDEPDWLDELSPILKGAEAIVANVNEKINPEEDFAESEYNSHEDRFIVFFIDQASLLLARTSALYASSTRTVGGYYIDQKVPFGDVSKLINKSLLATKDKNFLATQRKLIQLREMLANLTKTNYYTLLKKVPFDAEEDVYTNGILAIDPLYSACYDYYPTLKDLLSSHEEASHPSFKLDYHSYALAALLLAFDEKGFVLSGKSPEFDNKNLFLKVRDLKLARGDLSVYITSENDDHIDLLFDDNSPYHRVENLKNKKQSKVSLDLFPSLGDELYSKEEASAYFKRKVSYRLKNGYQNAFVITGIKGSESENAILLLPTHRPLDANLSSMIDSCLFYLPGDYFTYSRICPICGAHMEDDVDGNFECSRCGSEYTLLALGADKEKKEIVWVKRLKNLEGK